MEYLPHEEHQFDALVLPWLWCRCCRRTFVKGTYRPLVVRGTARHPQRRTVKQCPYANCSGQILRDSYPWSFVRQSHPDYPDQPVQYVIYPFHTAPEPAAAPSPG